MGGAAPQPARAPPRCTKCNSPPIDGQSISHRILSRPIYLTLFAHKTFHYRIVLLYNGPLLCVLMCP